MIKQEVEEQNQAGGGWWINTWLEWEERNQGEGERGGAQLLI